MTDLEHAVNVSELSRGIGEAMGLDKRECVLLAASGLLHDVGKICVPPGLLHKPGALTPGEYRVMQWHPTIGYLMLSNMPDTVHKEAAGAAYAHHEKLDGSGYPLGLSGQSIPLMARIVAVADVYDALVSDRPYRKAWPVEKAVSYMRSGAGKWFDEQVVDALLRVVQKDTDILRKGLAQPAMKS